MTTKTHITTSTVNTATEQTYASSGSYSFTVPTGVTRISAVLVGGGGGGIVTGSGGAGGGGGGLRYINELVVTPGEILTVEVGAGGTTGQTVAEASDGGLSRIRRGASTLIVANGGIKPTAQLEAGSGGTGSIVGGNIGGGNGGNGGAGALAVGGGGGGAGGYTGNGGNGGTSITSSTGGAGQNGSGGGGGGGGAGGSGDTGGGGGGVGLLGLGSNGLGGAGGGSGDAFCGTGGSGGLPTASAILLGGGLYGGGAPGGDITTTVLNGANGAVRIIWGTNRLFPSSNVTQLTASANFTTKKIHVRSGGQWRRAKGAWTRVNGVWQRVYNENVGLVGVQSAGSCYSAQGGFSVDLYQGEFVLTMGVWPTDPPNCNTIPWEWLKFGGTNPLNPNSFRKSTNGSYIGLLNTYGIWFDDLNSTTQFNQTVTINFPTTGNYTFSAAADNGCTISLDGTTIITNSSFSTVSTNTRSVTAGSRSVQIIANNSGGQGSVFLEIKNSTTNEVIWSTLELTSDPTGNAIRAAGNIRPYWTNVWTLNIDNMATGQTTEVRAPNWPYTLQAYTYRVTKVSNTSISIVPFPSPWGTGDTGTTISVFNWWENVARLGGGGTSQVQTGTDAEGNPTYTTVYNPGQINLNWTF